VDTQAAKPDPIEVVAEALRAFGDLTAGAIAEKTGMAYSTVTPKLRTLRDAGRAEPVKTNGRTFWRLTTPPVQASAVEAGPDTSNVDTDGEPDPAATTEPPTPAEAVPTVTDANTSDHDRTAGTDATPTTDATQPADEADSAEATPADPPAPDPAPDAAPESEPTAVAPSDQASGDGAPAPQTAPDTSPADGKTRRPPGALARTALHIMQANPDTPYKVTELGRLIDQADAADGHQYPNASPGAVVLACDRLVDRGDAAKVVEKPATYQVAAAQPAKQ
jgi:hypothetical protein